MNNNEVKQPASANYLVESLKCMNDSWIKKTLVEEEIENKQWQWFYFDLFKTKFMYRIWIILSNHVPSNLWIISTLKFTGAKSYPVT